jgi:hypothetical protein
MVIFFIGHFLKKSSAAYPVILADEGLQNHGIFIKQDNTLS